MKTFIVMLTLLFCLPARPAALKQNGPLIPGVEGPFINFVDGKVLVEMKLLYVEFDVGLGFPIPKTTNSTIAFTPNVLDGGTLVSALVDVKDFKLVNIGLGVTNKLPDGRPIQGVPGGELRESLRLDLGDRFYNVSVFYHKVLAGIYIPFRFDLGVFRTIALPLKWKGKIVGSITVTQAEGSLEASGTVFLNLDKIKKNQEMQKLLELSRQNPGKVF